ncbi:MAG: glyoxalase [Gammaproteobacteria bacterium]|nr:glyoxalase [Gammaproteobacteria bacterium]
MSMNIGSIPHVGVIVDDTEQSLLFYRDILGLRVDVSRPDLGYPGAWLNVGKQQIHLMEIPNPDPVAGRPHHGGRDRHIALTITDINALVDCLGTHNINYTRSVSGRNAVFLRDPDGNALEFIQLV